MTVTKPTQPEPALTVTQAIQQAVAHHRAGELPKAERLYRAILNSQPRHPDANHNLGVIAVQMKKAVAGLPHFKAALEAAPAVAQYWLSYIEALIQAGQLDAARQVLALGRQKGLQGEQADALTQKLAGGIPAAAAPAEPTPVAVSPAPTVAAPPQAPRKPAKPKGSKASKPAKATKKAAPRKAKDQGSLL